MFGCGPMLWKVARGGMFVSVTELALSPDEEELVQAVEGSLELNV